MPRPVEYILLIKLREPFKRKIQNDFGMPKITWSNHKSFGIEENPPPHMGKTPKKFRIFFLRGSLNL